MLSEEGMSSQQPCGWGRRCAKPAQTPAVVKTGLHAPPALSPLESDFEESDRTNPLILEAGPSLFSLLI